MEEDEMLSNKRVRLLLMIVSFGLGQGSMFFAQTYLLATGNISLIANIGLFLSVTALLQWVVDWGALIIQARESALGDLSELKIASVNACRLLVSCTLSIFIVFFAFHLENLRSELFFVLCALPSLLIWSINLTGVMDGLRVGGWVLLMNNAAWLFSSIALIISSTNSLDYRIVAGTVGGAFSLGSMLTVIAQYNYLYNNNIRIKKLFYFRELGAFFKEGYVFNCANIPAQIYPRLLLVFISQNFGTDALGIAVYLRSIITACSQFISFVRRIEFSEIVRVVGSNKEQLIYNIHLITKSQYESIYFSIILAFLSASYLWFFKKELFYSDEFLWGSLLACFAIIMWTLASIFGQTLIAVKNMKAYSKVMISSIVLSLMLLAIVPNDYGLKKVYAVEITMYVFQIIFYWRSILIMK